MKTTAISVLFPIIFLFTWSAFAQSVNSDTLPPSAGAGSPAKGFVPKKMDVHVQAGTWFATSSGYGNGWGTYIAPQLSYSLTTRFRLSGGFTIMNTSYNGYKPYYDFLLSSGPAYHGDVTSAYIYISGQYLVNDRLTVTGTAF